MKRPFKQTWISSVFRKNNKCRKKLRFQRSRISSNRWSKKDKKFQPDKELNPDKKPDKKLHNLPSATLPNSPASRWQKLKKSIPPKLPAKHRFLKGQNRHLFRWVARHTPSPKPSLSLRLYNILKSVNNQVSLLLPSKTKCLFSWRKNSLRNCWPRLPHRRPRKPRHSNNNTCKLKLTRPKHRSRLSSSRRPSKISTRSMHKQILNPSSSYSSHSYSRKQLSTMSRLLSSPCSSRSCNSSMRNRYSRINSHKCRPRRCSRRYHNSI